MPHHEMDFDVVVAGGGASGALVATHYRQAASFTQRLALVEASGHTCRGAAYGTKLAAHLLNVPASRMSAFEREPGHFAAWLATRLPDAQAGSYAPRMLYAEYLHELLHEERPSSPDIVHVNGTATRLTRNDGRWVLHLEDGRQLASRNIVLALGNLPPADPVRFEAAPPAGYVADPWRGGACEVPPDSPVVLVGTGQTMYDVVLSLRAQGHRGPLHALSRHGRTPAPQRASWPRPLSAPAPAGTSPLQCLRWLRAEIDAAAREGYDWRTVIFAMRGCTASIWKGWSSAQKSSFLRHARSLWDAHRHRAAPEVNAQIEELRRSGTLRVLAGRILSIGDGTLDLDAGCEHLLEVRWRARGAAATQVLHAARVINCTGPATDYSRARQPLVAQLRGAGWLVSDALGLGVETEDDGALIDRAGRRIPGLYAIGRMRMPRLWETTAIPEIRVQAAALARQFSAVDGSVRREERVMEAATRRLHAAR